MNTQGPPDPIRIAHLVGVMDRGGIETWLMHMLRTVDRDRFRMDFITARAQAGAYDDGIRSYGGHIIAGGVPPWTEALCGGARFRALLHRHGPYHIVHSHVGHRHGSLLRQAAKAGVPVRIAHTHNDLTRVRMSLGGRAVGRLERWLVSRYAQRILGCSRLALASQAGEAWQACPRCEVLYYGLDLAPFATPLDAQLVRAELGIPAEAAVIGHVGNFKRQKNHGFLLDVFHALRPGLPQAHLLLVGDGELRPVIAERAAVLGLADRVAFTGSRPDVGRLMRAMDLFLFPSHHEGLGIAVLEAQAAGLPCLVSTAVPDDVTVVEPLVVRLSLAEPAAHWAEVARRLLTEPPPVAPEEALRAMVQSQFNVREGARRLERLYSELAGLAAT